jgi:hypothetical protein
MGGQLTGRDAMQGMAADSPGRCLPTTLSTASGKEGLLLVVLGWKFGPMGVVPITGVYARHGGRLTRLLLRRPPSLPQAVKRVFLLVVWCGNSGNGCGAYNCGLCKAWRPTHPVVASPTTLSTAGGKEGFFTTGCGVNSYINSNPLFHKFQS